MIHDDLYGQKAEIEKNVFLNYNNIPAKTRQRVYIVITENVLQIQTLGVAFVIGKGLIPSTNDYEKLWHEIKKLEGIPYVYETGDDQEEIHRWLMRCSVMNFLQAIELFIHIKVNETQLEPNERLHNTINDINKIFKIDKIGYEIVDCKIQKISQLGFETMTEEAIETNDSKNIDSRIKYAISKFSYYNSSIEDKKEAVRTLADILEYLRKSNIKFPKNDDSDLFNLINNFDIRHHNQAQKGEYDKDIWYDWMFYTFLASIHVLFEIEQ